ncbi:sulfatase domain-containing protein [Sarocladium implicatum]|nr:sulfatase domain-containing protein [Sarocladium implicatum]
MADRWDRGRFDYERERDRYEDDRPYMRGGRARDHSDERYDRGYAGRRPYGGDDYVRERRYHDDEPRYAPQMERRRASPSDFDRRPPVMEREREREYYRDPSPRRPGLARRQSSLDTFDRRPLRQLYEPRDELPPPARREDIYREDFRRDDYRRDDFRRDDLRREDLRRDDFREPLLPARGLPPPRRGPAEYDDIKVAEPDHYGDDHYRPYRDRLQERELVRQRRRERSRDSHTTRSHRRRSHSRSSASSSRSSSSGGTTIRSEYPKKGKTRIPARLVSKRALIDLRYPYEEEGNTIIVQKALGQHNIDELLKLSEDYKQSDQEVADARSSAGDIAEERRTEPTVVPAALPPPPPASHIPPPPPASHIPPPPPASYGPPPAAAPSPVAVPPPAPAPAPIVIPPPPPPPAPVVVDAGPGVRFDRDYSPSRASSVSGYDHSGPVPGPLALAERPRSHSRSGREIRDEIRMLERELAYRPKGQVIESSGNREIVRAERLPNGELVIYEEEVEKVVSGPKPPRIEKDKKASTVPALSFIIYSLSFFVPDVLFISIARILLRRERNVLSLIGYTIGITITGVTFGAASSELGFYIETGGEIQWEDATAFAGDKEGRKVLMDGAKSVGLAAIAILLVAWCLRLFLYRVVGDMLSSVTSFVASAWNTVRRRREPSRRTDVEGAHDAASSSTSTQRDSQSDLDAHERQRFLESNWEKQEEEQAHTQKPRKAATIGATIALVYLAFVALTRPSKPYNHMSTTLPWPLLDAYQPAPDLCQEQALLSQNEWPLTNLTAKPFWKEAHGYYKGWTPGHDTKASRKYKDYHPDWLPQPAPPGFYRWDAEESHTSDFEMKPGQAENKEEEVSVVKEQTCAVNVTEDNFYSPVTDPLKITNLDDDLLGPLKEVLHDDKVKIKHVMFILMESMREELFPLQQGSDIHKFILDTYESDARKADTNIRTAQLTPNAEKITGKPGNFHNPQGEAYQFEEEWKDKTKPGFGGINIVGGFTPSSVSTKSLATLHCGTWPLPVDKFEEADLNTYQPCLPQIFDLFNKYKDENETNEDFTSQSWSTAFFQATTDHYDRQNKFDGKLGFHNTITKNELGKHRLGGDIEEINYFGYPETALKPYMEEYINQTLADNKRMFLSHFTSTTHHPWGLPEDYTSERYLSLTESQSHKDMNSYLNTVRFVDSWLGEMMQMLEDFGIADETLVVFVGDHGQAFKEDTKKTGTYENGHVSNFRVPITLRHPLLPRIQYEANATSVSLLPTVLDLLISTNSLNEQDLSIASDLVQDYEGQSLIRPYKTNEEGRRAWNFGLVNSGGGMLTITSADAPWRLVMPLGLEVAYVLTDLKTDPLELKPVSEWTQKALLRSAKERYGAEAAAWAEEAEAVARWWIIDRKRLWGYNKKN